MKKSSTRHIKAVVIGVSTGGVVALKSLLGALPADFPVPVLIVSHIKPDSDDCLARLLNTLCTIRVKEADERETIAPGTVYLAPANYHLLVEKGGNLALSVDPIVNYARPSVDVLFDTAAEVFGPALIGIILTGAGNDGSKGLLKIRNRGGVTIIQDPDDADMASMPASAQQLQNADHVVKLKEIPDLLMSLVKRKP
jgi:two-component system chemotaxis response regulator CheB